MVSFKYLLLISCSFFFLICHSQDEHNHIKRQRSYIDSLYIKIANHNNGLQLANEFHDLGKHYFFLWEYTGKKQQIDSSIYFTKKAIKQKQQIDSIPPSSIKKSLYNLAIFYEYNKNVSKAIHCYNEIVNLKPTDANTKNALLDLAVIYRDFGEYENAISYLHRAIDYLDNDTNNELFVNVCVALADVLFEKDARKNYSKILHYLNKAEQVLSVSKFNENRLSEILQIRGNTHLINENYFEAIKHHEQISTFGNDEDIDINKAKVYNSLGVSYLRLKQFEKSKDYLNKARAIFPDLSDTYENLGDLYLEQLDFENGMNLYQKALNMSLSINLKDSVMSLPSVEALELSVNKLNTLHYLITKANGWFKYYKYNNHSNYLIEALKTFKTADKLIDIIRTEGMAFKSKLYWREQSAKLYEKAVEACFYLNNPDQAFYFMERNKALLLLENITYEKAKRLAQLPDSIAEKEYHLKQDILLAQNNLNKHVSQENDALTRTLKDAIFRKKIAYKQFLDTLQQTHPKYTNLKKQLEITDIKNFKTNYCSGDQVVLHYLLGEAQGFGLCNTLNTTHFFKIADGDYKRFKQQLSIVNNGMALTTNSQKVGRDNYASASEYIFKSLFPNDIAQKLEDKEVVIIPDGNLQYLPFEALVNPATKKYLIEETDMRYAYSISLLENSKNLTHTPTKNVLALAPIHFSNNNSTSGLMNLKFSSAELDGINQSFSGDFLKNNQATKTIFLNTQGQYKVLHLATHANANESNDESSYIAFTNDNLSIDEIYAYKNQADLVVLSGCQTARGTLQQGEGVMSLARGFFNSGSKSVVSTLWSVYDKSNSEIMTDFYKNLKAGKTKSVALREAKLNYIKQHQYTEFAHPNYWAAPILVGDNSPIADANLLSNYWIWLIALVMLLGILLFLKYRRKALKYH